MAFFYPFTIKSMTHAVISCILVRRVRVPPRLDSSRGGTRYHCFQQTERVIINCSPHYSGKTDPARVVYISDRARINVVGNMFCSLKPAAGVLEGRYMGIG